MWEPGVVRGLGQGRAPRSWGVPWGEQGKLSEGQVVGAGLHQALFSAGATLRVPGHLVHACEEQGRVRMGADGRQVAQFSFWCSPCQGLYLKKQGMYLL